VRTCVCVRTDGANVGKGADSGQPRAGEPASGRRGLARRSSVDRRDERQDGCQQEGAGDPGEEEAT